MALFALRALPVPIQPGQISHIPVTAEAVRLAPAAAPDVIPVIQAGDINQLARVAAQGTACDGTVAAKAVKSSLSAHSAVKGSST